jgi:hypothetical protein
LTATHPVMRQNVDAVSRFDGFVRKFQKRPARDNARVVDEDINFADFLLYGFGNFVDLFLVGDIDNISAAFKTLGHESFCGGFDR